MVLLSNQIVLSFTILWLIFFAVPEKMPIFAGRINVDNNHQKTIKQ